MFKYNFAQYVDEIPKKFNGIVGEMIAKQDKKGLAEKYIKEFELQPVLQRKADVWGSGSSQAAKLHSLFRTSLAVSCSVSRARLPALRMRRFSSLTSRRPTLTSSSASMPLALSEAWPQSPSACIFTQNDSHSNIV